MATCKLSGLNWFRRVLEIRRSVSAMGRDRKNGSNTQLPTRTTTSRALAQQAWRHDLASRLGMSVAEVEASINGLLIEDSQLDSVRKIRDANGGITTLVRFPGGYRPATHVEPANQ